MVLRGIMSDLTAILFSLFAPLAVICGAIFASSFGAHHKGVARVLRRSAIAWFIGLGCVFTITILAATTCGGNALDGYTGCTTLPVNLANLSGPAFVIGVGGGIL